MITPTKTDHFDVQEHMTVIPTMDIRPAVISWIRRYIKLSNGGVTMVHPDNLDFHYYPKDTSVDYRSQPFQSLTLLDISGQTLHQQCQKELYTIATFMIQLQTEGLIDEPIDADFHVAPHRRLSRARRVDEDHYRQTVLTYLYRDLELTAQFNSIVDTLDPLIKEGARQAVVEYAECVLSGMMPIDCDTDMNLNHFNPNAIYERSINSHWWLKENLEPVSLEHIRSWLFRQMTEAPGKTTRVIQEVNQLTKIVDTHFELKPLNALLDLFGDTAIQHIDELKALGLYQTYVHLLSGERRIIVSR